MSALWRVAEQVEAQRSTVEGVFLESDGLLGLLEHVEIGLEDATAFLFTVCPRVLLVAGQVVSTHLLADYLHTRSLALFLYWIEVSVRNLLLGQKLSFGLVDDGFLLRLYLLSKAFIVKSASGSAIVASSRFIRHEDGVKQREIKGILGR